MKRIGSLLLVVVVIGNVFGTENDSFRVHVYNSMIDSCELWAYGVDGQGKDTDWNRPIPFLNRQAITGVTLAGNDPFYLAVRLPDGDYSLGRYPVKEFAQNNPNLAFTISGVFGTRLVKQTTTHNGKEYVRFVTVVERQAVIVSFIDGKGQVRQMIGTKREK